MSQDAEKGENPPMSEQNLDAFVRGLKIAMDIDGWKMKPLSQAAGMGESAIRDLFRKSSSPKVSTAHAIADAMGRTVDEIISLGTTGHPKVASSRLVAVAGRVGAGARVDLVDAYAKGDGLYHVMCPAEISPHGTVAVEVVGDSMSPIYEPGSILFYSREILGVPTEAIGRICVCADVGNGAWVKQVKLGSEPGLYHLISINPNSDNIHDILLHWAAPVKFHLPAEYVRKIVAAPRVKADYQEQEDVEAD